MVLADPSDARLLHIQRLGADRLAGGIERDLLDARFRLAQQFLTAALKRLPALVDCYRFFQWHFALFQALDDRFELLDCTFEGQFLHVGVLGHYGLPALDEW